MCGLWKWNWKIHDLSKDEFNWKIYRLLIYNCFVLIYHLHMYGRTDVSFFDKNSDMVLKFVISTRIIDKLLTITYTLQSFVALIEFVSWVCKVSAKLKQMTKFALIPWYVSTVPLYDVKFSTSIN